MYNTGAEDIDDFKDECIKDTDSPSFVDMKKSKLFHVTEAVVSVNTYQGAILPLLRLANNLESKVTSKVQNYSVKSGKIKVVGDSILLLGLKGHGTGTTGTALACFRFGNKTAHKVPLTNKVRFLLGWLFGLHIIYLFSGSSKLSKILEAFRLIK